MCHMRFLVGVMMFMASFITYSIRINFSVLVGAMVKTREPDITIEPDYGPRYEWSKEQQLNIIAVFYYGFLITSFLGGTFSEVLGGRNVVGFVLLISAIVTVITPLFGGPYYILVAIIRFILGLFTGTFYSSCHYLISKWAPPDEKGKFIATLLGGASLAMATSYPVTTMFIHNFTWPSTFTIEGIIIFIFVPFWWILVSNVPQKHWFIKAVEVNYINQSLADTITSTKKCPPYKQIFTSIPYLVLICAHFGSIWGLMLMLSCTPKFMQQVLKYDLNIAGFLSCLPSIGCLTMSFVFGSIGDYISHNEILNITKYRKICCVTSHIIPGGMFLVLGIAPLWFGIAPSWLALILIILSFGLSGAAVTGHLQNFHDLAPNFAASLYGIAEFFSSISGFLVPIMVAYFTKENNTQKEWAKIYVISGIIYIITASIFIFFGTAKIQKWNYIYDQGTPKESSKDEKVKN